MTKRHIARVIPSALVGLALLATPLFARGDAEGRWKVDGNGGCYFDINDEGPNQCDPPTQPGRWKIDGAGGCYLDTTDSGPNQCTPPEGGSSLQ